MIDTAQPQVKSIENSTSYGKFEIEPLEPGFGTTLGNALRRLLLFCGAADRRQVP